MSEHDYLTRLKNTEERYQAFVDALCDPENGPLEPILKVVENYGGPEAIERRAQEARSPENLREQLQKLQSPFLKDIDWLEEMKDKGAFVSLEDYTGGMGVECPELDWRHAPTLEISSLQFFAWLRRQCERAVAKQELIPGRFIRVRSMSEQKAGPGELWAMNAAMQILGSSYVECLDTRGSDGSNIHLGGPETLFGYLGGVGQPNRYPYRWVEEYLSYYTTYGIKQVLNVNPGTLLAACLLRRLGIGVELKLSVLMGVDNLLSALYCMMPAVLWADDNGQTPLAGMNLSNSVDVQTIIDIAMLRRRMGLEDSLRLELHVTETFRSVVRQPYLKRSQIVDVCRHIPNIAAKHEGGEPEVESNRPFPSDLADYFKSSADLDAAGLLQHMFTAYMDKHDAIQLTAKALVKAGLGAGCAPGLHGSAPEVPA